MTPIQARTESSRADNTAPPESADSREESDTSAQATTDQEQFDEQSETQGVEMDTETTEEHQAETTESYQNLAFTLYLRPGSTTAVDTRQERIRTRLEKFDELGIIDTLSVQNWSKEIRVRDDGNSNKESAIALFERFTKATEAVDARLEPFFQERTAVDNYFSPSPTDRILVFPTLSIAFRQAGELVGLYPCWRDGIHHSVGSCLERLEHGESVCNLL